MNSVLRKYGIIFGTTIDYELLHPGQLAKQIFETIHDARNSQKMNFYNASSPLCTGYSVDGL
jgi:hypothetical protein